MAIATLVSRLAGFLRAIVVVALIGGTSAFVGGQAFGVANELPTNVYNLLAGGILGAVLVPEIVRALRGGQRAREDLDRLLTMTLSAALVLTIALVLAAPLLVRLFALTWPQDWLTLATLMAYWSIPQVFFFVVFTVLGQVMNAHHVYGPYAWAPVISNLVGLIGLAIFAAVGFNGKSAASEWSPAMIAVLCGSATLGVCAQSLITVGALRRVGFSFRIRFGLRGLRGPGSTAALAFLGVLAGQLAFLVVSNVANSAGARLHVAGLDAASLNSLSYAYLVMLVPHGVLTVSIATAQFTTMSHEAAAGQISAVRDAIQDGSRKIAYVSLLATAVFVTAGPLIGEVLWHSLAIGVVLSALSVGLTGFSEMYALNRASLALRDGKSVLVTQGTVALLTALFALGSAAIPSQFTVVGIAVGISIANLSGWLLAAMLMRPRLAILGTEHKRPRRSGAAWRLAASTTAGLAVGFGLLVLWPPASGWWALLVQCVATCALSSASFVGTAYLLGVRPTLDAPLGLADRR